MLSRLVDYMREDEFRMTIFKDRIHVINYEEVLSLEEDLVRIRTLDGTLFLRGKHLSVAKLMDHELLLLGQFTEIEMKSS